MGRKKKYTHKKIHAVQYICWKKKKNWNKIHNWVHEYCIDCAFHTPNPEEGQGRGLCSVKQWDGGRQKEKIRQEGLTPCNSHWGTRGEKGGGKRRCVCVLTFCRHSEKTGSSFQTPVQAKEWVSSVKESDTELSQVFFQVFHYQEEPPPPSLLSNAILVSWLEAGWLTVMEQRAGRVRPQPPLPSQHRQPPIPRANPKK